LTIIREEHTKTTTTAPQPDWPSVSGESVTVRSAPNYGSDMTRRATDIQRLADQIVSSLRKLLSPEAAHTERIIIYLADGTTHEYPPESIVHSIEEDAANARLALQLSRRLVEQWFGERAARAAPFVEGCAGLALAEAGSGTTVEAADESARDSLKDGRAISINGSRENADESTPTADRIDPAAISFLGFLAAVYGPSRLHQYFAVYDPDRHDQAALSAYHQPLAVLEEEWIARLRRHGDERNALRAFLRQILPLLRPYKWKQAEILFYLMLAAGYNVVQPWAIKVIIGRLIKLARGGAASANAGALFVHTIVPFILLLLGINVVNGIVSLRRAYTVNWLNQTVLNTLQVRMFAHLQRLAHGFYVNAKVGDLMARINDDLDAVQSALSQITNKALYQTFTVIGAMGALFMLAHQSPAVSLPILFIIPLFAVNYAALRSRNKQASREQRRRAAQAMVAIQQNLAAHALIKAFGMEVRTIEAYRSRVRSLQQSKLRLAVLNALTDLSEDATTALAQLIIFGVGGYLVLRDGPGGLKVEDVAALIVLVKSIFGPIASLAGIGQTMQQATGAMERVSELFDEPVTIRNKPDAKPLPPLERSIRFEHVTFRYDGDRPALVDVTVDIPAGRHVALVGPSGSGKSSIINLLLRFWDPEEGRVLFDGCDLRDVTLESLRAQIGLVFQETFIFDTTLRENIAVGRPEATDAEIAAAAKAAQLDTFIESLPAGYDTIPGESGAKLSVGQKQRIAIARAFLRNPRILILDEATSALDAHTEAGVLETLSALARGRTTVSVTHRISQASTADLILVLEAGRLVEQGTHAELLMAGGLYRKLYEEATGFVGSADRAKAA
jgi:ABC-type multidrug transport system fused ATPase/permease subunit